MTDRWDQELIKVYARDIFDEEGAIKDRYKLAPGYEIPEIKLDLKPLDENEVNKFSMYYKDKIKNDFKSNNDPPEAFGQHVNAEISSQTADT